MPNIYSTIIKLWNLDRKLYIFPFRLNMGRLKFVRASKFWKLPAQLACNDFCQSFTPVLLQTLENISLFQSHIFSDSMFCF